VEPLPLDVVRALEDALPSRYRALVTAATGTGLRQGECFGLTVDRVDFLRRVVTVDRQLVTVVGREPFLAPPKTSASVRTVPLPQAVLDARHFYASLLIRHGESVKVVQARLGHASAAETLDTYSHLWPDSDDRTRAAVDAVLLADSALTEEVVR
jgi:integrase